MKEPEEATESMKHAHQAGLHASVFFLRGVFCQVFGAVGEERIIPEGLVASEAGGAASY